MGTSEPADNDRAWRKNECIALVLVDNSETSMRLRDSFVNDTATGVTSYDTTREPVSIDERELKEGEVEQNTVLS
jgi:hypothetical protein